VGYSITALLQIVQRVCEWKNFENWLIFVKDRDSYKVGHFFETQCMHNVLFWRVYKLNWTGIIWFCTISAQTGACRSTSLANSALSEPLEPKGLKLKPLKLKILYACCFGIFLSILAQFNLEMCALFCLSCLRCISSPSFTKFFHEKLRVFVATVKILFYPSLYLFIGLQDVTDRQTEALMIAKTHFA